MAKIKNQDLKNLSDSHLKELLSIDISKPIKLDFLPLNVLEYLNEKPTASYEWYGRRIGRIQTLAREIVIHRFLHNPTVEQAWEQGAYAMKIYCNPPKRINLFDDPHEINPYPKNPYAR
jgi:hypothetical protein